MRSLPMTPPASSTQGPGGATMRLTDGLAQLLGKHQGVHEINSHRPNYFILSELIEYWTDERIGQAFRECRDQDNAPLEWYETIRKSFIRLFSLLVWIQRLDIIQTCFMEVQLKDESFPLVKFPSEWDRTQPRIQLYNQISKEQWKFFPLVFDQRQLHNQILSPRHIIPLHRIESIRKGNESVIDRIYVEPLCAIDVGDPLPGHDTICLVRKQYIGDHREDAFRRERRAYEELRNQRNQSKHLVKCYGAFRQQRIKKKTVFTLILEHVDDGDLESFFSKRRPSRSQEQVAQFWTSLSGALEALCVIHQIHGELSGQNLNATIVHQDIKPSNYLISKKSQGSPYDFDVKLADFGYSFTNISGNDDGNTGIRDLGGGQTYGAPESSHHEAFTQNNRNIITPGVDVWSLGCIMSQACVWLAFGGDELRRYEELRGQETRKHRTMDSAGHAGCFHDGYKRLKAVGEYHERVLKSLGGHDIITPGVIQIIEDSMLRPAAERQTPYQLHQRLIGIIDDANYQGSLRNSSLCNNSGIGSQYQSLGLVAPPPSSTGLSSGQSGNEKVPERQESIDEDPVRLRLTYKEALLFYQRKKDHEEIDQRVAETIDSLRATLNDRDFIYFIDNSTSMRKHKEEIRKALRIYAYITKSIDSDGIEASFASDPSTVTKFRNSTALLNEFDRKTWSQATFEAKFSTFIKNNILTRLPNSRRRSFRGFTKPKQLSILVLTDGRWGNDRLKACGIERPIMDLINKMRDKDVNAGKTHVSIQFMRFGDDADGMRHLDYLDQLGKKHDMDIVDTKRYDSDVCAMLLASVDQEMDADGETPETQPANSFTSTEVFNW